MIEILDTALNQWDIGRSVQVTEIEADHVHFANKGDSRAVIMGIVDSQAKIPDYLLQTGKQLCVYAVKNGVTVESKIFYVKTRERPEEYVYEEDQRNYIYELITDAQTAIDGANDAAAAATERTNAAVGDVNTAIDNLNNVTNAAVKNANTAASSAITATTKANVAANSADLAAKIANEAADNANNVAKSLMVIGSAKGNSIYLDDAIEQFLVGMRIFGKTTQDGTPTPDSPVELVSVGDIGSITVNVTGDNEAQSMTIATPNGLPGIPVTSGGNYTDASGQQWFCDEIDLARGVRVQRCFKEIVIPTFNASNNRYNATLTYNANLSFASESGIFVMCDKLPYNNKATSGTNGIRISTAATNLAIAYYNGQDPGALTLVYPLATPIETPLSEAELAAYAAMHTYRGNTTISNSGHAYMDLEYVMDAKKYIDSQISAGILAATVE